MIVYRVKCCVFVKVDPGPSSASLSLSPCWVGPRPVCLHQLVAVVSSWRRVSALNQSALAAGTAYGPLVDCSLPTGTIPVGNRSATSPAGVPLSSVRDVRFVACKFPFLLDIPLQDARLQTVAWVPAQATVSGGCSRGYCRKDGMRWHVVMPCSGSREPILLASEVSKDNQGVGGCVLARPHPVSAVKAGVGWAAVCMLSAKMDRG